VTTFLIVCAVMIVAALALLLVPLLREEQPTATGEKPATRAVPAAVAMMVVLPLAASAFYAATSNFPWDNPAALTSGAAGHAQGGGSIDEVTAELEARLAASPGDMEGWRMLGRTYLVSGRTTDAVRAYQKASALAGGNDPEIQLDLAEALVLTDDPARQGQAREIIDAALAADGNNQKALWYSGLIAQRGNDPETAKARWSKLLETNPPPEIRQILVAQLAELGVTVPPEAGAAAPAAMGGNAGGAMGGGMGMAGETPAASSGRTMRIAVSVDPALAGKLKPGSIVFVSAREAGIPGPPLAAVRLSADELPTTVVLSDANAMVEGRDLSSVDEVQVVARVAFGGTAVTASGDLIGESRHRKGAPADLAVVINRVSP
jgi:cytochrome c-type biogenesis protein CcmH